MATHSKAKPLRPDLCVIGAGSGGLTVAVAAAAMGVPVVLIERSHMGGDCLNVGCVPSKSLIAAGAAAAAIADAPRFGVRAALNFVDPQGVHAHIRDVIDAIAPTDSEARMRALGIVLLKASARFVDARTLDAGGTLICPRRFVIATGSRPSIPPIKGLADVSYLTNETVFDLTELPRHLAVIGAGPIGLEIGQAYRRLGAAVTIFDTGPILPREDWEAAGVLARALEKAGVRLETGVAITELVAAPDGVGVHFKKGEQVGLVLASHLLVATGRAPVVDDLGLEDANIAYDRAGIRVDKRLRSPSNRRVYAVGDVAGGPQFTHAAGHQAGLVLRNALFRLPIAFDPLLIPRVTFTDPELASVGLDEAAARKAGAKFEILRWPFAENDRARAGRTLEGLAKVLVGRKGTILGVSLAGPHAGELIMPWVLAMQNRLPITAMAGVVAPYPTLSEVSRRAAMQIYTRQLRNPWLPRLLRALRWFG